MRVSDRLRDRATRLRVLATEARDEGKVALAAEITRLAAEPSDQADSMDRSPSQDEEK
jgi:hypothetical protein